MTPPVAIALITKLKMIFETDADGKQQPDRFLAFQNGSFSVAKENFYFIEPDKYKVGPIDTALKMVDFSKSYNFITAVDDLITPAENELNDVYHQTLTQAIGANSSRSAEEEQRYNAAKEFLYQSIQTPDGQTITRLANYDNYENQYKEALSEYKSREVAAMNAQGDDAAAIKAAWQNDMPDLKKAIATALLNWETLGQRTAVEKYLGDFLSLAGSSPSKTIADLKQEYELFTQASSVDHLANEVRYIPTYFTPINFFEDDISWQSMSLDKSEVNGLMQQAPQRLKDLFDINTQNIDIIRISFEYMVVDIVRDWLHYKDFLLQHFWKLSNTDDHLSDGAGNGNLPAFPDKMIFIRNLRIEAPHSVATPPPGKWRLTMQLFQKLKPQVATSAQKNMSIIENRKVDPVKIKKVLEKDNTAFEPVILMHTPTVMPLTTISSGTVSGKPAEITHKATTPVIRPMLYKANMTTVFRKPLKPILGFPPKHKTTPSPAPTTEITEHKEMELLAFLCRKVPACPSPDPQLQWD